MDNNAIASDLKAALLYRNENDGAVKEIAEIMNLSRRTVYDYLDGRIKINVSFLHAACLASNGDPDIKKFLEPKGWKLVPAAEGTVEGNVEKELGDIHLAAAKVHETVREAVEDGRIDRVERWRIMREIDALRREIAEIEGLMRNG